MFGEGAVAASRSAGKLYQIITPRQALAHFAEQLEPLPNESCSPGERCEGRRGWPCARLASSLGSGSVSGHGMGVGEGGRKVVGIFTEVASYAVGMILIALR